jgi:hypothetical protein
MGEVIRANFGGDRKKAVEEVSLTEGEQPTTIRRETILDSFEDTRYVIENLDRITRAKDKIDEITDFIFDRLQGYVRDDTSIALRREGLRSASIEQLVNYMVDSTETDWKKHPSFYGAVILEYRDRVDAVLSLMGSDENT